MPPRTGLNAVLERNRGMVGLSREMVFELKPAESEAGYAIR